MALCAASPRACGLLKGNRDALGSNSSSLALQGWVEGCEDSSRTVRMVNRTELAVKGADLPSTLTPDLWHRAGTQISLSTRNSCT